MTTLKTYTVTQFGDGLAIVPSCWFNDNKTKCSYPTFRNPTKVQKAVVSQLLPEDNKDWKIYDVLRIFYTTNSYQTARENLIRAENVSDLTPDEDSDDTKRCDNEKKSRHLQAKKNNSSSEEYGFDSDRSQELKKLAPFPKIPDKSNITGNKRIPASQKTVPSLPSSNVERSRSECQMSPAIHTESSYKEATISRSTQRKYRNNSSDENNPIHIKTSYKKAIISRSIQRKYCDNSSDENKNL